MTVKPLIGGVVTEIIDSFDTRLLQGHPRRRSHIECGVAGISHRPDSIAGDRYHRIEILRAELVMARTNASADRGQKVIGAELTHPFNCGGQHSFDDSSPSRMGNADHPVTGEHDRHAVSRLYGEDRSEHRRYRSIGGGPTSFSQTSDCHDIGSVGLTEPRPLACHSLLPQQVETIRWPIDMEIAVTAIGESHHG